MKAVLFPTLECNLRCSYCYLHGKKTRPIVDSLKGVHYWNEWIDGLKWFEKNVCEIDSIDFSGGEPFLYKDIIPLLKGLLQKYGRLNLTSNLEKIPDEFYNLDPFVIGMTVSLHLDEHGRVRKNFLETMKRLRDKHFRFVINFVGYPKQIDRFEYVSNVAATFGTGAHLEPYIDYNSDITGFSITDSPYYSEYDKQGIEYSMKRKYPTDCNIIGKYAIFMPNGDVYPCLGMMFEKKYRLANIFEKTMYDKSENPIKCDIFCPCAQNFRDGYR